MKVQKCKGYRDLLPQDMVKFRHIEGVFRSSCLKWGYQEVRTPTLEYLHLFTSAGTLTPQMLSKVYSFLDWNGWSGERVVLRPEGTIPVARLYVENMAKQTRARLFYVENMFRFEEAGQESREHWQCGAELIGSPQITADGELVLLALEVLDKLGCRNVELRLSHAGLLKVLSQELASAQQDQIFDRVLGGDLTVLEELTRDNPQLRNSLPLLFKLRGKSAAFLKNLMTPLEQFLPGLKPSLTEFIAIAELLSILGCEYEVDITSGRGFEYYTGVMFQFYLSGKKIGGGGRYNDLIPLIGGGNIPASGFALYLDSLTGVLEPEEVSQGKIVVKTRREDFREWKQCFEAANRLRQAGYIAEIAFAPEELQEHRWVLVVQSPEDRSPYLLIDQVMGKKRGMGTLVDIVEVLKEQSVKTGSS